MSHSPAKVGRFEVVREIARGGMGIVYEVRDPQVDRRLAVKVLARGADNEYVARLRTEGEATARLKHPNIVTIHEVALR